jgi:hypothetical protein
METPDVCNRCGRRFDMERENYSIELVRAAQTGQEREEVWCQFCIPDDDPRHVDPREWFGPDWENRLAKERSGKR